MSGRTERVMRTAARGLLGTVGRASKGVRIGHRHGFDSALAHDYVYANTPHGLLGVLGAGRLVDRAYLGAREARALRARYALLQRMLREEIAGRGGEIVVLDAASGPGRCLQDLVAEEQPGGQLRVVCRDVAPEALARGRRLARERGLPPGALTFEWGDALDPAPLPGGLRPDLVVVPGLYERIADGETVRASLEALRALLAPGGTLLFTARRGRPADEAGIWPVKAGFAEDAVSSRREASGRFSVTRCATV
ncbi:hypothetical protein GCM10009801_54210 [Streptomyces albiaxialis]|uniref:Methyltransferase domain-containing protein n=1 Tax=Streptomyces albiaxialis TaxID=329523 RepID=A0ABP5HZX1_9ACTN